MIRTAALSLPLKSPPSPSLFCSPTDQRERERERPVWIGSRRMGLPSDLTNVSSDSIPILLVALAANGVCYVKSLVYCLLQAMGLSRFRSGTSAADGADVVVMGSGLAGFIVVREYANVSRAYTLGGGEEEEEQGGGEGVDCEEEENEHGVDGIDDDDDGSAADCVVCLSGMREGEQVRRLACCHVFHRSCLEGWFDHQQMSCPLCRAPLRPDDPTMIPSSHA